MQKVDGVQNVRVSLNGGLTILDFKPGNAVTLSTLRQIIKDNGFVSKEANIFARGKPRGDRLFVVGGTNEQLTLSATPQEVSEGWRMSVSPPKR